MKLPLVPTLTVALALPILIALGIWQLGRADEKDAMLAALAAAPQQPVLIIGPDDLGDGLDFRLVQISCAFDGSVTAKAGRNQTGAGGFSYFAPCGTLRVNLGWDARPDREVQLPARATLRGMLREGRGGEGYVLITDPALGGLVPSLQPSVDDIPDNHTAYAVQWFGFATVLGIIYVIYVRGWRRRASRAPPVSR